MRHRYVSVGPTACSFCGDTFPPNDIVQGPLVQICRTCVDLCHETVHAGEGDPYAALEAIRDGLSRRVIASMSTSVMHHDPAERHDARIRINAYRCALDDVEAATKAVVRSG